MAAADQIKSLIKSFAEGDEVRFYATAMQIAASEARNGHPALADELKKLIDKEKLEKALWVEMAGAGLPSGRSCKAEYIFPGTAKHWSS